MKIPDLSNDYRKEYEEHLKRQYKSRTALFIIVVNVIYYLICSQYAVRFALGNDLAFRFEELYDWLILFLASSVIYWANRKATDPNLSKIYSHLFNVLILIMISRIGFLYHQNAMVFPFYFALGLILFSLFIPWSVGEIMILSVVNLAAYTAFYVTLVYYFKYEFLSFPRFHPYLDGTLYILIASLACIVWRKKTLEQEIQNFSLQKEIEKKNLQIHKDLEFANIIHRALIPESIQTPFADVTVNYHPASYVGGDYAKFHFYDNRSLMFFICDVTGHGVASALLVNRIHTEFERLAKEKLSPGLVLQRLDSFIRDDFFGTGMFLSAFCGTLDFSSKKFSYSNYGHPAQYLNRVSRSSIEKLEAHTTFLGVFDDDSGVWERSVDFEAGDIVFLFTDGLIESLSPSGELFGTSRVETILKKYPIQPPPAFNNHVMQALQDFNRGVNKDDVLFITIQIH